MNKELLEKYAKYKKEEKLIQSKIEEIKEEVTTMIKDSGNEEVELKDHGKFILSSRRQWKYPEEVQKLEDTLKGAKKESEQVGTATYTENFFITFRGTSDE